MLIPLSLSAFLLYFCVLRGPNDVDFGLECAGMDDQFNQMEMDKIKWKLEPENRKIFSKREIKVCFGNLHKNI